ncbi:MAG: sulfurtransferase [Pseudomonadota bacterium]
MNSPLIEPRDLDLEAGAILFDCRFSLLDTEHGRQVFADGHIPGAQRLDMEIEMSGARSGRNGRHPLPTRTPFEQRLRAAGVNDTSQVIVYDAAGPAGAARAWWLLRWFGFTNVTVLHGGIAAWQRAGLALEAGDALPPDASGNVQLRAPNPNAVISLADLSAQLADYNGRLIDAREAERYRGEAEPIDPVAGCIPGAVNLPWGELLDANGRFHSATTLRERWNNVTRESAGSVLYCGSGVTACVLALSRAVAGLPDVAMYAGGFSEWCADPARPIAKGA